MARNACRCDQSMEFERGTCATCGRALSSRGVDRLSLVLAEICLGRRPVGDRNARPDRKGSGRGRKAKGT